VTNLASETAQEQPGEAGFGVQNGLARGVASIRQEPILLQAHMPRLSSGASSISTVSKSPDEYVYILIARHVSMLTTAM
jgi:hypothetical protein